MGRLRGAGFILLCLSLLAPQWLAAEHPARARLHQIQPVQAAEANERAEIRVGREVAARILARHELHPDAELQRYVNLVGRGLSMHGERPALDFYFAVLDSEQINAYAAPGGYVFVTAGALALMEDEAELVGVLAHEIAHVDARHIVNALGIRAPESSPMAGLTRFFGGAGEAAQVFFSQTVEQVVEVLFEEGLQRDDEFQADAMAVRLAARAGYDPQGLSRFLERMSEKDNGRALDEVSSTHPAASERLSRLSRQLDEEGLSEADRQRRAARFQRHVP
ncbi:putative Zn-dependent protease [Natronospira proteinivora]|uniref:Zn-dependent protease n=1 Tax=Natronospira proteinivora TaxID=1807133 RepID=A0ABT1G928_9GAMM|nr:M48 family metalloprotease [Natronospira proteinivora]MCP1727821.1 putative Zn-dependent protease [Natronospira proteinivora]